MYFEVERGQRLSQRVVTPEGMRVSSRLTFAGRLLSTLVKNVTTHDITFVRQGQLIWIPNSKRGGGEHGHYCRPHLYSLGAPEFLQLLLSVPRRHEEQPLPVLDVNSATLVLEEKHRNLPPHTGAIYVS